MTFFDETTKVAIAKILKRDRLFFFFSVGALFLTFLLTVLLANRQNWIPLSIVGSLFAILFLICTLYFFYRCHYERLLKRLTERTLLEEEKHFENVFVSVQKKPLTMANGLTAYPISFQDQGKTINAYWMAEFGPKPQDQQVYDLVLTGALVKEAKRHEN